MRVLSTIQPTKSQKIVMAVIAANKDKPNVAKQLLSNDRNLIAARNFLINLNAIEFADNLVGLTTIGTKVAVDNNLIDQSGALTDYGQSLVPQLPTNQGEQPEENPVDLPTDMGMEEIPPMPMEGFSQLFKSALLG